MRTPFLVAFAFALALPAHAAAPAIAPAATADTLRLTLDDAVNRALANAPEARSARAGVTIADGQVREATAQALPQVTGTLTYDRRFASPFQSLAGDPTFGPLFAHSSFAAVHNWTAELTGSQILWSGGRVGAGLAAARAVRSSVRATRDEALADLALQVRGAYLDAAMTHELRGVADEGLTQAREHLRLVQAQHAQGVRSEYDLLQAQVDAANAEPQSVAARNGEEQALLQLRRLLNLPLDQPLGLVTPLAFTGGAVPVLAAESPDGGARPAIAGAEAMVQARRQALRAEIAGRWPTLSASATVSHQAYPTDVFPSRHDFVAAVDGAVKLQWPLFQGFRTFGTVQQATGELRRAEADRDRARAAVSLDVQQARQDVRAALATLAARRGTAELARKAHHLAQVRWSNGLSTQLEVSDARLRQQTAEVNEIAAVRDYRMALLRLERATGRPLATTTTPIDQLPTTDPNEGVR